MTTQDIDAAVAPESQEALLDHLEIPDREPISEGLLTIADAAIALQGDIEASLVNRDHAKDRVALISSETAKILVVLADDDDQTEPTAGQRHTNPTSPPPA